MRPSPLTPPGVWSRHEPREDERVRGRATLRGEVVVSRAREMVRPTRHPWPPVSLPRGPRVVVPGCPGWDPVRARQTEEARRQGSARRARPPGVPGILAQRRPVMDRAGQGARQRTARHQGWHQAPSRRENPDYRRDAKVRLPRGPEAREGSRRVRNRPGKPRRPRLRPEHRRVHRLPLTEGRDEGVRRGRRLRPSARTNQNRPTSHRDGTN